MGIQGLLPFMKNSCRPANIKDFKGCTVAIDAYSWMHKGAFSCADKIAKGESTDGYVYYCMKQLYMLLNAQVKPIMVFDGCNLESKSVTEKKRREYREKIKQKAKEYLCEGKIKEARDCFQKCVDVTPEMALEVIQACKAKDIDCIVAPYEADAQLAYLNKANIAQLIITEDSDLIVFGCDKILYKMDCNGTGCLYEKQNLPKSFGNYAEKMSFDKFRYMCILSGCDYLPSLPGIGLVKACKFFTVATNPNLLIILSKIPSYLKMPKLTVDAEYKEAFFRANNTFLYQLAFCPKKKTLLPLNPYPDGISGDDMTYAGKYVPNDLAYEIALGNVNVKTMKNFDMKNVKCQGNNFKKKYNSDSIWNPDFISRQRKAESSFKIKSGVSKSPVKVNPRKQDVDIIQSNENVDLGTSDQSLFSAYQTEKPAEVKKEDISNEEEGDSSEPPLTRVCPFRKSLSANSVNISRDLVHNPYKRVKSPETIVKSRFFSDHVSTSQPKQNAKLSWLDSIDNEFIISSTKQNSAKEKDENPMDTEESIVQSIDCSYKLSQSETLNDSLGESFNCDSSEVEIMDSSPVQSLEIPNTGDSVLDSSGYESMNSALNLNEEVGYLVASSTNKKKRTSSYFDSIVESSLEEESDSKKSSGGPIMRCRTMGLSKKKRPQLEKQLAVKETLFNFNFTRHSKIHSTTD